MYDHVTLLREAALGFAKGLKTLLKDAGHSCLA
jgi:hypothetical protein